MAARRGELPAWVELGLLPFLNLLAAFVVSGLIGAHAVLHPFSCRRLTGILSTSIKQGVFDAIEDV